MSEPRPDYPQPDNGITIFVGNVHVPLRFDVYKEFPEKGILSCFTPPNWTGYLCARWDSRLLRGVELHPAGAMMEQASVHIPEWASLKIAPAKG